MTGAGHMQNLDTCSYSHMRREASVSLIWQLSFVNYAVQGISLRS